MTEQRIIILVERLNHYLQDLRDHVPETPDEYLASLEKRRFCERTLQLLIECCIDISNLLVKDLRLGIPSDEGDTFMQLSAKGIISEHMANTLKDMKLFRNVLVHHYLKIDDGKVYDHATKQNSDFEDFKREILEFLREQRKKKAKQRKRTTA